VYERLGGLASGETGEDCTADQERRRGSEQKRSAYTGAGGRKEALEEADCHLSN
jgi:hypothetical protein